MDELKGTLLSSNTQFCLTSPTPTLKWLREDGVLGHRRQDEYQGCQLNAPMASPSNLYNVLLSLSQTLPLYMTIVQL